MSRSEKHKLARKEKSDIRDQIKSKDKAYVLFYASWCPYSRRFLPVFEEYEKINPKECMKVVIDDAPDLCDEYAIEYYPTVILFQKGKVHKRLDAQPGVGLDKKQLKDFTGS